MRVRFQKKEKIKTIVSSVFLFVIVLSMLFSFLIEKKVAMLICFTCVLTPPIIKIISLWLFLGKKKNTPYIVLSEHKMVVDSFRNGKVEIDLKDILDIKLDEDTMEVYVNRTIQERKSLFYYFMPNMDDMYQFPIWGKKEEMKDLVDNIRKKIPCKSKIEDVRQFSNLCGSYLFILAGIPFLYVLASLVSVRIEYGIVVLSMLTLVEMFIHRYNHKFLTQAKGDCKTFLRCIGLSAWIAQLIVVSCEVQEKIMKTKLDVLQMKPNILLPLFGIYFIVFYYIYPKMQLKKN